jgi:hypothetical protein
MSTTEISCFTKPDVYEFLIDDRMLVTYYKKYPYYLYLQVNNGVTLSIEVEKIDDIIKVLSKVKALKNKKGI